MKHSATYREKWAGKGAGALFLLCGCIIRGQHPVAASAELGVDFLRKEIGPFVLMGTI